MNWIEIGLSIVIVGAIIYGISLYRHPPPWDDDEDQ